MPKYVFDPEHVLSIKAADKADPQKIGEALEAIAEKAGGHLTPEAVVDAAREKRHVLHRHFEWDDQKAAEAFRLDQARNIVRSIHVENDETESGLARAYLSIQDRGGRSYRSISDVLASADLQSKVLASAETDLLAFERRYRSLTDVCAIVREAREQIASRRSKQESRGEARA